MTAVASTPLIQTQTSTSAKKLDLDASIQIKVDGTEVDETPSCYLFMDTSILLHMVELIGPCPICYRKTKVNLRHDIEKKKELAHFLTLSCVKCNWSKTLSTSKTVQNKTRGKKAYAVIASREIGRGHAALKKCCGYMNLPPPMTSKTFLETQYTVMKSAQDNMKAAAKQVYELIPPTPNSDDDIRNITIFADGTWQKRRGFSSLNGAATVIANDTGKSTDHRVKTKHCNACKYWKQQKSLKVSKFKENHDCPINHQGASGQWKLMQL